VGVGAATCGAISATVPCGSCWDAATAAEAGKTRSGAWRTSTGAVADGVARCWAMRSAASSIRLFPGSSPTAHMKTPRINSNATTSRNNIRTLSFATRSGTRETITPVTECRVEIFGLLRLRNGVRENQRSGRLGPVRRDTGLVLTCHRLRRADPHKRCHTAALPCTALALSHPR
jgi:hypothetical protein